MNILVPDSWLREYLKTEASPKQLKDCLSLCGPSIERINTVENDTVYDIEITSNRVDMASIYGIAREAAAILPRFGIKAELYPLDIQPFVVETQNLASLPLRISDPEGLCHRLLAVVIDNVTVQQAPRQMRERIEASGIRSLNNLIDVTNYVMLELGHPCHVFDYDRIRTGKLLLRKAKKGETMITLDGKKYTLSDQDIIIDDGTGQVIDLPGIMGTANSVVTDKTKRIVVFIESNDPVAIRRTSMRHGIRTYAATINEKHPDPELAKTALLRAIDWYREIAGGTVASDLIDIYPHPTKPVPILVSVPFITQRLGVSLPEKEIIAILQSLSFQVETRGSNVLQVTPPTFRQFDVSISEDIVEEVARIYGYYRLPGNLMTGEIPVNDIKTDASKIISLETTLKHLLRDWGYTEIYTYSFQSKELIEKAGMETSDHIKVANPLTEEITHMRRSIFPSLLATVEKNQFFRDTLSLFELSHVYHSRKNDLPEEKPILMITTNASYQHLKGIIEQLLESVGIRQTSILRSNDHPYFHPNKAAYLTQGKRKLGAIGSVHPQISERFHLKQELFLGYLLIDELLQTQATHTQYVPISPYPAVQEDFSLQFPERTEIGSVINTILSIDQTITSAVLKDIYMQTITIRVTYQNPQKNLTTEDTQAIRKKILAKLEKEFSITLKT